MTQPRVWGMIRTLVAWWVVENRAKPDDKRVILGFLCDCSEESVEVQALTKFAASSLLSPWKAQGTTSENAALAVKVLLVPAGEHVWGLRQGEG